MAIPEDLNSRQREAHKESTSVAGQTGVVVINPDGSDIGGGGGGTQYTEGDTDATITGTAIMWEDAGNTLTPVNSSKPLPVDLGSNNDVNVAQLGSQNIDLGAGAVGAGTQRMTLASDDPAVALLGTIDADTSALAGAVSGNEVQVDVVTAPARARTADSVSVGLQTDVLMNGLTALTPKFAVIDAASAGNNTLVTAVADKKIRVTSLFLVNGHTSTQTVRFESGANGTALTGQMILGPNGGFVLPFNPNGWFETAVNTLLNLELSGATTVDGSLTYIEV